MRGEPHATMPRPSPLPHLKQLALLGCLLGSTAVLAQQPQTPQQSAIELQPNPLATLRDFEPPANQPYQLGRGDQITVTVLGRPELSGQHIIGPDGDITLPLVGSIQLAGLTRGEAAAAIKNALGAFYTDVVVSVGVDQYTSNQILVLGAVEHPGIMSFDKTPTLLEAVSRAGVPLTTQVTGQSSAARPSGIPDQVMIYRGNDTMVTVQLRKLLDEGSPLADMRLQRDDVVYVSGRTSFVSVLGQVTHPGNEQLDPSSTLTDLIAEAGGPTEKAGRDPAVEIIHRGAPRNQRPQSISYNQLIHHHQLNDITLQTGDIIFIPESGFNDLAYTFQQLAPLVNIFTIGTLVGEQ